jgi:hypothetical protein
VSRLALPSSRQRAHEQEQLQEQQEQQRMQSQQVQLSATGASFHICFLEQSGNSVDDPSAIPCKQSCGHEQLALERGGFALARFSWAGHVDGRLPAIQPDHTIALLYICKIVC